MKANLGKGPEKIAEIVSKGGVKVTPIHLSNIKATMGIGKKKGGKRVRKPGSTTSSGAYADVQSAVVLVQGVGGLDTTKQLLALPETARGL